MNTLFAKILSTLKSNRSIENPIDLAKIPISTAAFTLSEEPEQTSQGQKTLEGKLYKSLGFGLSAEKRGR